MPKALKLSFRGKFWMALCIIPFILAATLLWVSGINEVLILLFVVFGTSAFILGLMLLLGAEV